MKLIFSIFLINFNCYSRNIIEIQYDQLNKAKVVKNTLINEYNIPKVFIKLKKIRKRCLLNKSELILGVCVQKDVVIKVYKVNKFQEINTIFRPLMKKRLI